MAVWIEHRPVPPIAVIISAVFWAWLWGPIGLVLATPITVCIVVVGKYLPALSYLEVLLGDRPPIATSDRFYQRLLAFDGEEVTNLCEDYTEKHSLAATFDEVIVPALGLLEEERGNGQLQDTAVKELHRLVRAVISDLSESSSAPILPMEKAGIVLCLPASSEADELSSMMLTQLLLRGGVGAEFLSSKALAAEMVEKADQVRPKLICVSALPPASTLAAQHLCRRLHERVGAGTRILVGIWNDDPAERSRRVARFKRAHADEVFIKLADAAREILLQAGCTPSLGKAA